MSSLLENNSFQERHVSTRTLQLGAQFAKRISLDARCWAAVCAIAAVGGDGLGLGIW